MNIMVKQAEDAYELYQGIHEAIVSRGIMAESPCKTAGNRREV